MLYAKLDAAGQNVFVHAIFICAFICAKHRTETENLSERPASAGWECLLLHSTLHPGTRCLGRQS